MHEMSLAESLLEQILEVARENRVVKVEKVEMEAGVLRQVIPDVMVAAFESTVKGTIAEGAWLTVTEVKAKAECRECLAVFEPAIDDFVCPECGLSNARVLQGEAIVLKSIEGEEDPAGK